MVNFGLNSASLLGIFLAVAGAGLYFMRSVRPELSRDHDIFFAAIGLLCGFILIFQGWRLDPILQFGQFLLAGSAVFFAVETIRLRGVATEQARRNTPIVDEDRPVRDRVRVYKAELEQIEPYETEQDYENRRLRGYPEPRSSRRPSYEEAPRSTRSRNTPPERYNPSARTGRSSRRPRTGTSAGGDRYQYRDQTPDKWEESSTYSSRSRRDYASAPPSQSSRRRPPRSNNQSSPSPSNSTDYVDYQPVDPADNSQREPGSNQERRSPRNRGKSQRNPNFDY